MEQIFRKHDPNPTGTTLGNYLRITILGYADDAALVSTDAEKMTERLDKIARGSKTDADMQIHMGKTKCMHVRKQPYIAPPTIAEIKSTEAGYKHECKFCGRRFKTSRGMRIHLAACNNWHGLSVDEFPIGKLNAVFGTPENRWYRVEWIGYPGEDSWEPERSLTQQGCQESIQDFWSKSKLNPSAEFVADPDDKWRCWTCGKSYKLARTLKAHITRTHTQRQWHGSTADRDTRTNKKKIYQQSLPRVSFAKEVFAVKEGKEPLLDNAWVFKYLGSRFRADGSQYADITARIASATTTAGKMRNIWASRTTPLQLKLRIYRTGVCSKLVYGCEAWFLDAKACAMLNGANSRMMSHITGRTVREEASKESRTFDVLKWIRARRLQWAGHILRLRPKTEGEKPRMIYTALRHVFENKKKGDLLMDAPPHRDWEELLKLAADRSGWRRLVQALKGGRPPPPRLKITINPNVPGAKVTRPTCNPAAKKNKIKTSAAKRQRTRDAHHALFHPKSKKAKQYRTKIQKKKKKKKARAAIPTNKEKQAAARAKWHATHGPDHVPSSPLPPRDIFADWPPNFGEASDPQPSPPPPTPTFSPRKHKDNMAKLRRLRRGRFRKKTRRGQTQPQPQPPPPAAQVQIVWNGTIPQISLLPPNTPPSPNPTPSPILITPTKTPSKVNNFPTPTNNIYSHNMQQLTQDLLRDQNNHCDQNPNNNIDLTGTLSLKNKNKL